MIHDACKSCETCSLVTGSNSDLSSRFLAKLSCQSGPHWTVSPCSLVTEHVGFLQRRRRDFVNRERKSLEAVELSKGDIVEGVFSRRK